MRLQNSGIDGAVWYEAGGKLEKAESTISLCRTVYPSGCEALLKVISKPSQALPPATRELSRIRPVVGGYIAFQAMEM